MTQETLLSAARRAVRFFNIDNTSGGGLISRETCSAMETLDRMWRLEADREMLEGNVATSPSRPLREVARP